jgi:hypothetical protein
MSAQGQPVQPDTELAPGDAVYIEWYGSWYPGEVLALARDGTVKVHYSGWESMFDEQVPRSRLRTGNPGESGEQFGGMAAVGGAMPMPPPPSDPLASLLTTQPVLANTAVRKGDRLLVEWFGYWWPGEVVQTLDNGQVKIHYSGWDSNWDEVVARDRLRVQTPPGATITVHLDRGWSLTGTLVEAKGDVVTLLLAAENKRLAIFKHRIAYIEMK